MQFINEMTQMSLFHNLRTGNIIFDMIISSFIAIIFSSIMRMNVFHYMNLDFLYPNRNTISLTCTESRNYNGRRIMDTSETFRSVLSFIKQNIKDGNTHGLKNLSEYYSYEYDDEYDETNESNNTNFKDTIYLVNQSKYFTINTPECKNIYFKMIRDVEEIHEKRESPKEHIIHTLKIFSKKYTLKELQTFVDKLHKDYNDMINKQYDNKQFVFVYEGMDSGFNTKFKSYPFQTTCSIDKVFFEGKEKIMSQINFFKNNKRWYEKHGKPYTLGICNYGLPGCGKTSFEKSLCKYLNRHMIIVDFSRIKYMQEADDIFFSETINGRLIPYNKRLYVFPDIDRMTELLYDNNYKNDTFEKTIDKYIDKFNIEKKSGNEELLKMIINEVSNDNDLKSLTQVSNKGNTNFTPINLSKLLNIIDGVPERTGQVIMMSANNIEKIDKALLRPGRIDCSIHFKKASLSISKQIIQTYMKVNKKQMNDIKKYLDYKYTPAELFNICYSSKTFEDLYNYLNKHSSVEVSDSV